MKREIARLTANGLTIQFLAAMAVLLVVIAMVPVHAGGATLDPAQKSAICQGHSNCTIGKLHDGGKSKSGASIVVAEIHLGLKDKPDDAPDEGCRADDKFDGGVEYWLLEGTQPPKRVLKFCNDGYGAAGVGEDDVSVAVGMLIHKRVGGSAWRWDSTTTYTLSPWRAVSERDCSFNNLSADNGTVTDINFLTMNARSVSKDSAAKWGEDVGCPNWPSHLTAHPAPNLLGAYNVVTPLLGNQTPAPKVPSGTVIGDCVPAMTTGGVNGFLVFGDPAPVGHAAEIRTLAESYQSLLIQVFDPEASGTVITKGSWINLPHVEVWVGLGADLARTRLPLASLAQVGVDLNGKVYAGAGKKPALPVVERWLGRDAAGHPVVMMRLTWSNDTEFANGVAVVYSQAQNGRQQRLVATTGIVKNRPLFLPDVTSLPNIDIEPPRPGKCAIKDGRLSIEN